jgi:hypothetical protein
VFEPWGTGQPILIGRHGTAIETTAAAAEVQRAADGATEKRDPPER